jgi:hypothetical protein
MIGVRPRARRQSRHPSRSPPFPASRVRHLRILALQPKFYGRIVALIGASPGDDVDHIGPKTDVDIVWADGAPTHNLKVVGSNPTPATSVTSCAISAPSAAPGAAFCVSGVFAGRSYLHFAWLVPHPREGLSHGRSSGFRLDLRAFRSPACRLPASGRFCLRAIEGARPLPPSPHPLPWPGQVQGRHLLPIEGRQFRVEQRRRLRRTGPAPALSCAPQPEPS